MQLWDTAGQERYMVHSNPPFFPSPDPFIILSIPLLPACLQVSEFNDCILQRCHGFPPAVRPHKWTKFSQRQKLDEYVLWHVTPHSHVILRRLREFERDDWQFKLAVHKVELQNYILAGLEKWNDRGVRLSPEEGCGCTVNAILLYFPTRILIS